MVRKTLLLCGIASALLYVASNLVGALLWRGYSTLSQTVSELSAIDAPSRPVIAALAIAYNVLVVAFGCGIWQAAEHRRGLRVAGASLMAMGLIGFFWPPMHQREVIAAGQSSLTDTLHIVFTVVTSLFILVAMVSAATALGRRFRSYSIATIVVVLVFGAWTGVAGPRLNDNLPTPWIGLTERINIGAYLLWTVVLAIVLLRGQTAAARRQPGTLPRSGLPARA